VLALVAARSLIPVAAEDDDDGPAFALSVGPLAGVGALAFGVLLAEGAVADWGAVYLCDVPENDRLGRGQGGDKPSVADQDRGSR
jgi:hypothetical protein